MMVHRGYYHDGYSNECDLVHGGYYLPSGLNRLNDWMVIDTWWMEYVALGSTYIKTYVLNLLLVLFSFVAGCTCFHCSL